MKFLIAWVASAALATTLALTQKSIRLADTGRSTEAQPRHSTTEAFPSDDEPTQSPFSQSNEGIAAQVPVDPLESTLRPVIDELFSVMGESDADSSLVVQTRPPGDVFDEPTDLPRTGRLVIRTYGSGSIQIPVGPGYVTSGSRSSSLYSGEPPEGPLTGLVIIETYGKATLTLPVGETQQAIVIGTESPAVRDTQQGHSDTSAPPRVEEKTVINNAPASEAPKVTQEPVTLPASSDPQRQVQNQAREARVIVPPAPIAPAGTWGRYKQVR